MTEDVSVIRLITLVLLWDCRNGTVTLQPRTPSGDRPPRQMSVDRFEQIILPLVDPRAAKDALAEGEPGF